MLWWDEESKSVKNSYLGTGAGKGSDEYTSTVCTGVTAEEVWNEIVYLMSTIDSLKSDINYLLGQLYKN